MEERHTRDKKAIQQLYNDILPALGQHIHEALEPVLALFENFTLERLLDTWTKDPTDNEKEVSLDNGNIQNLGLKLRLEGFNQGSVAPFDMTKDLLFKLEHDSYTVGPNKNTTWMEKAYLQRWSVPEFESIAGKWTDELVDEITEKLQG
ncbi:hypothetical protein [Pontibacter fetidus]|uniref:Uncharacterized protein n=1 Tax=Pontibacter fetidus TaxID=2700082 RepID=A0A6B2H619_9BACT|nr:hypothetical protein [Pontibacter fetidus]NDK55280.1 hypothetical protein [Pontibacter fetidus]